MTIDIICPLYNAEKHIEQLDKSLRKQEDVEINKIRYVLTRSKDNSEQILKKIKATYKVIEIEEFSHSIVREKEAFESEADIIVFITQDIIIEDTKWLYNLIRDIENGKCEAAYSNQICDNNSIEKYTRELNYPNKSVFKSKKDIEKMQLKTFFFSDASSAIKRDVFVELNGYDNRNLPTNEDMYIAYKLIMNDYTIKYCADSKVIHSHNFSLKEVYNRYFLTGRFFKQNDYLNQYKVNNSGAGMAKYVFKRAMEEKNWSVLLKFLFNMMARFFGMEIGKL